MNERQLFVKDIVLTFLKQQRMTVKEVDGYYETDLPVLHGGSQRVPWRFAFDPVTSEAHMVEYIGIANSKFKKIMETVHTDLIVAQLVCLPVGTQVDMSRMDKFRLEGASFGYRLAYEYVNEKREDFMRFDIGRDTQGCITRDAFETDFLDFDINDLEKMYKTSVDRLIDDMKPQVNKFIDIVKFNRDKELKLIDDFLRNMQYEGRSSATAAQDYSIYIGVANERKNRLNEKFGCDILIDLLTIRLLFFPVTEDSNEFTMYSEDDT